ncbi:hypothetical protein WICPIJ_000220 [Wickerhamomyces pijperi]|uniref:Uncharacterized protein n=1 Tax=Wickerhamomyces pijperi TaxID=599730 RepID=A0A9P8TSZ8_WICPI|nr:hypothetical protein WICPIJ_000220 [Wickerhamomyces pijperi]
MRDEKDDLSLEELEESEQDDDDDDEEQSQQQATAATRPDLITVTQPSQMSLDTLDSNSAENAPVSASLAPKPYVTRSRASSISTTGTGTAPSIVSSSSVAGSTTQITRKHTNVSQMSQLSRQQSILSNMLGDNDTHNTHQIVKTFSHQVVNSENLPIQFDSISIKPKSQPAVPSNANANADAKQSNTSILHTLKSFLFFMLDNLKKPISLALLVAITIAMIPWVRAIFVQSNQVKIHSAPDNQPPLSFIIDFATYLGNASVPCGLLLLGATLSRLNIGEMPRFFWITPLLLSIMRLILMPIVGCLICWGLKKAHWFEGDDMLLFVCLIVWGVPNATSIIYISAYYAPIEKELQARYKQLNYLSLCYAIQYTVLIVSLPFLCVFSVKVILEY